MPKKIQWDQSFSVGHSGIDEQHKQLISACNDLVDCLVYPSLASREHFLHILDYLRIYADHHFRYEEDLLTAKQYPALESQKASHQDYVKQITEILHLAKKGKEEKQRLYAYLGKWWVEHILHDDMQYKDYVK